MRGFIVSVVVLVVCGMVDVASCQPMLAIESPVSYSTGHFGWCVSGGGDVDGDGFLDLVVGAPNQTISPNTHGSVYVLRGRDGSVLHVVQSQGTGYINHYTGHVASFAGDPSIDGFSDFATDLTWADETPSDPGPWGFAMHAYSGETGQMLWGVRATFVR
ncbi:FG-GAP repeat protein [Candidatus Fermentibacteria bacterium]|nr:FG-GAP repeat protein [Candidatus Fermentibacteria bacterium]